MDKTRRTFLKLAGIAAAGLGAGSLGILGEGIAATPVPPTAADFASPLTAKRWAMVIDTAKFDDALLQKCITACHRAHNVPEIPGKQTIKWLFTGNYEETFPTEHNHFVADKVEHRQFLMLCNHCTEPPCVRVCPTKATFKREEDGLVMMDYHRCIGCRYCMAGCPYGARSFNFMDPRPYIKVENPLFPTRTRGVVEKCTFCVERLAKGLMPACVEAAGGAMYFGDLEDPQSEVRKVLRENFAIRRKPDAGTQPGVYYII